jgi:hypothetical protein
MSTTIQRVQAILDPSVPRLHAPSDVAALMRRLDALQERVAGAIRGIPLSNGAVITDLDRMSAALATVDVLDPTAPEAMALIEGRYRIAMATPAGSRRSTAPRSSSTL